MIEAYSHPLRIDRNIARLKRNVAEYSRKLADIENDWTIYDDEPPKHIQMEYDDLYSLYIDDTNMLEALIKIKKEREL